MAIGDLLQRLEILGDLRTCARPEIDDHQFPATLIDVERILVAAARRIEERQLQSHNAAALIQSPQRALGFAGRRLAGILSRDFSA